jgi:hypothetical protein
VIGQAPHVLAVQPVLALVELVEQALPDPEGPMMARNSPRFTVTLTPPSASVSTRPARYTLRTPYISSMGVSLIAK